MVYIYTIQAPIYINNQYKIYECSASDDHEYSVVEACLPCKGERGTVFGFRKGVYPEDHGCLLCLGEFPLVPASGRSRLSLPRAWLDHSCPVSDRVRLAGNE